MLRIKICGLTNPTTAKAAGLAGANYIGLLFSNKSPRKVDLMLAKEIATNARAGGAEVVGVFADETLEQMQHIIKELQLRVVQLHYSQVKALCNLLDPNLQIIYVINKQEEIDSELPTCLNPAKDFLLFEGVLPPEHCAFRYFIAGKIDADNVEARVGECRPYGVDLSSGVESTLAVKDIAKIKHFMTVARKERFGNFGGCYLPELLMAPVREVEEAYKNIACTDEFREELTAILKTYAGRPTALTEVKNFAQHLGGKIRIFLKREDLLHTGAHKLNNVLGQCLLAKKMGKPRIIAETGAGQHGVATATACAMFGLECTIYMGDIDVKRQAPNVAKMRLLGANVISVTGGSATLKDAVNEALRDWSFSYDNTHYCLGSALGPYPFPQMVADFQSIIGKEAKAQMHAVLNGADPDYVIACVGGGSNSIGIFGSYIDNPAVNLIGVEAFGKGAGLGSNAARFQEGRPGVLHGTYTYVLQNESGQVVDTYSISAGLDYPAVGPQHADLFTNGRVQYVAAKDDEALRAFKLLCSSEGIIPALESSHALGYLMKLAPSLKDGTVVLVNLSGRGDKDLPSLLEQNLV